MSFPGYTRGLAGNASAEALGPAETSQCRALAARANVLSLDRPDLVFAAKESCRHVSCPAEEAW
eukprot:10236134-Alexandrium_andersonii.AAC.1